MRHRRLGALVLVVAGVSLATNAAGAGPWRARVVDAATGSPLPDVVVVSLWFRLTPGPVHMGRAFHAADEVITDAQGRVELPARRAWTWRPFTRLDGPHIRMFKGGYGPWQFRGTDEWSRLDVVERDRNIHHAWQQLERDEGAVIELPPAPTRDERLRALRASGLAVEVPPDRVPLWMAAYDREREALGLGSMRKPGGTP